MMITKQVRCDFVSGVAWSQKQTFIFYIIAEEGCLPLDTAKYAAKLHSSIRVLEHGTPVRKLIPECDN